MLHKLKWFDTSFNARLSTQLEYLPCNPNCFQNWKAVCCLKNGELSKLLNTSGPRTALYLRMEVGMNTNAMFYQWDSEMEFSRTSLINEFIQAERPLGQRDTATLFILPWDGILQPVKLFLHHISNHYSSFLPILRSIV